MLKNMVAADLPVRFSFFNSSTKRVRACVALRPVKYANWFSSKLSLSIATSNRFDVICSNLLPVPSNDLTLQYPGTDVSKIRAYLDLSRLHQSGYL